MAAQKGPAAKPGRARAPRGAKKRAVAALVGKKAAESMTPGELYAFWSARIMRVPPPLRTSFGNFTTVNSVSRFTFTTSTVDNTYLWIPWTPSPVSALVTGAGTGQSTQWLFNTLVSSPPQMVRPLRMSFSIECTTQNMNAAGSVRVYSYDNSIQTAWTMGVLAASTAVFASGGNTLLGNLISSAPDTEEFTAVDLQREHEWVSVPSSYPAYNAYYSFLPLLNSADGTAIQSQDIYNLILGETTLTNPTKFPGAAVENIYGGGNGSAGLGGLPPMRGFLLSFPLTVTAQSYRICIHRQDGARFAVNSLGASFATSPPKMDAPAEDKFLGFAKAITQGPSIPQIIDAVNAGVAGAARINNMLASTGMLGKTLLDTARTVAKYV